MNERMSKRYPKNLLTIKNTNWHSPTKIKEDEKEDNENGKKESNISHNEEKPFTLDSKTIPINPIRQLAIKSAF